MTAPPAPPPAPTTIHVEQAGPAPAVMSLSGDYCWILFRERATDRHPQGYDRYVLSLYQLKAGRAFDLLDVREVTYDFKLVQFASPGHDRSLSPEKLKELWERISSDKNPSK